MKTAHRIKNWQHPHNYMGKWYQDTKGKIHRITGVTYTILGYTRFETNQDIIGRQYLEHLQDDNIQFFKTKRELLERLTHEPR